MPCTWLGDVYYAGRRSEFTKHFKKPLKKMLDNGTELFMLNSNHEMHSGGKHYFKTLDWKRAKYGHRQEGSYFTLENDKFLIVGIDSDYDKDHRFTDPDLKDWLEDALTRGKDANKVNILLSANSPYKYNERKVRKLFSRDLKSILKKDLVDLWFWGDTHYCALFDRTDKLRFIGSCIGHGGFPYAGVDWPSDPPAPIKFLETESRFFPYDVRKDRGNNGYCVMKLNPDQSVELRYIDWRGNERYKTKISRASANGPLNIFS